MSFNSILPKEYYNLIRTRYFIELMLMYNICVIYLCRGSEIIICLYGIKDQNTT